MSRTVAVDCAASIAAAVRAGDAPGPATSSRSTWPASTRPRPRSTPSTWSLADAARAGRAADRRRGGRRPRSRARWPACRSRSRTTCAPGASPTTCSSRILEGWLPALRRHRRAARLAAAGAVVVGKTNLDEFAMGSSTENSAFGPTRNPHDLARVPGGSSGGSAAAVAAGFAAARARARTPAARSASRPPCAAWSGVKPTYGLVSRYGLIAFASSLDQIGPLSRERRRRRPAARRHLRARPADSTSLARRPAGRPRPVSATGSRACGSAWWPSWPAPRASPRTWWPAPGRPPTPWRPPAPRSRRSACRPRSTGCRAYYLIAPAEASSNLARYDGVRYGLPGRRRPAATSPRCTCRTRSAGFGAEVKRRIMLGTYALSAGYYDAYYGKAQQVRTLIIRDFEAAYERLRRAAGADRARRRPSRSAPRPPTR